MPFYILLFYQFKITCISVLPLNGQQKNMILNNALRKRLNNLLYLLSTTSILSIQTINQSLKTNCQRL
jgi:hypothetical protein